VVQETKGIEAAHGIGFAPEGSRANVSDEPMPSLACSTRRNYGCGYPGEFVVSFAGSAQAPPLSG
jgi:hypothetical protein